MLRKLRDMEQRIPAVVDEPSTVLEVGQRVGEFQAMSTAGESISSDGLLVGTLVGFFDPQCESCHEHVPDFVAQAAALSTDRTLAVVRDAPDQDEMIAMLAGKTRVVVEPKRGPIAQAFKVRAIPVFCRLGPDQRVASHGYENPA
jgi:hypothetical protein